MNRAWKIALKLGAIFLLYSVFIESAKATAVAPCVYEFPSCGIAQPSMMMPDPFGSTYYSGYPFYSPPYWPMMQGSPFENKFVLDHWGGGWDHEYDENDDYDDYNDRDSESYSGGYSKSIVERTGTPQNFSVQNYSVQNFSVQPLAQPISPQQLQLEPEIEVESTLEQETPPAVELVVEKPMEAESGVCLDCAPPPKILQVVKPILAVLPTAPTRKARDGDHPIGIAARKMMGVMYQNCDAKYDLVPPGYRMQGDNRQNIQGRLGTSPERYFDYKKVTSNVGAKSGGHFYFQRQNPPPKDCKLVPPVVFHMGGSPKFSSPKEKELTIDVFNAKDKFATMDCSGEVSAAVAAAGLRFYPNQSGTRATTASLVLMDGENPRKGVGGPQQKACFSSATLNGQGSGLQAGDLFVIRSGRSQHAMIIDSVGADALGVQSAKTLADCDRMGLSKLDFTVTQAYGGAGRMGVTRQHVQDFLVSASRESIFTHFAAIARKACYAKFKGGSVRAEELASNSSAGNPQGVKFLRFSGGPGCKETKPIRIVGEECMNNCKEDRP